MIDQRRTLPFDRDVGSPRGDLIGRRRLYAPSRRLGVRLAPLVAALIGLAALGLVVAAWIQLVPGDPTRNRIPFESLSVPPAVEPVALMPIAPEAARELNEKRPLDVTGPLIQAPRFRFSGSESSRARGAACLAAAAWYEAGEGILGQEAVMQVVLNRARHPAFPRSICGVVFQGSERSTGCQFTFTCDGAIVRRTPSSAAWARAVALASVMLNGQVDPQVGTATHYHTDWVLPYWAPKLVKLAKVDTHIFYTWPGKWGTSSLLARTTTDEPVIAALGRLSSAHATSETQDPSTTAKVEFPADTGEKTPEVGVGDRELRGAIVRTNGGAAGQFFIQVDGGTFAGNHAVAALALCKDRPSCRVYGWSNAAAVATGLPLSDAQRASLTFFYSHESNADIVLWNCDQIARSNKAQCLPADLAARAKLTG